MEKFQKFFWGKIHSPLSPRLPKVIFSQLIDLEIQSLKVQFQNLIENAQNVPKFAENSATGKGLGPDYSAKEKRIFFLAKESLITAQTGLHGRLK